MAVLAALVLPGAGRGDVGIVKVSRSQARAGDFLSIVAAAYLGPKPWRAMPVVMIPAALAPNPTPRARLSQLRPPRYRVVGAIWPWRARDQTGVNAIGQLRFRVPRVPPRRYVFALFCDACAAGSRGSLIIDHRRVLSVRA
jgi:hypothetical protein